MNTITIKVTKSEREKLSRIALRYGLSLQELAKKALEEVSEEFGIESLSDYKNPAGVKRTFQKALKEYSRGEFLTKL